MMCFNHDAIGRYMRQTGEREQLKRAIDRLKKRSWCEDATLALDAAEKWLATLPKPSEYWGVFVSGNFYNAHSEWPTQKEAMAEAARLIGRGESVSVRRCP